MYYCLFHFISLIDYFIARFSHAASSHIPCVGLERHRKTLLGTRNILHIVSSQKYVRRKTRRKKFSNTSLEATSLPHSASRYFVYIYHFLSPERNAAMIRLEASMEDDCSLRFFRRCDS